MSILSILEPVTNYAVPYLKNYVRILVLLWVIFIERKREYKQKIILMCEVWVFYPFYGRYYLMPS